MRSCHYPRCVVTAGSVDTVVSSVFRVTSLGLKRLASRKAIALARNFLQKEGWDSWQRSQVLVLRVVGEVARHICKWLRVVGFVF